MRILLTLDYELYFGPDMGSVERCLVEPTAMLLDLLRPHDARVAFFVDAGYLHNLRLFAARSGRLASDYSLIRRQLDELLAAGHEIQLHIHPHWEESYWDGSRWHIDLRRYRLHDFEDDRIQEIVERYHAELEGVAGSGAVFAFRAGGWVNQPFERIGPALKAVGIRIDSTVFPGGRADSATHGFDFRNAPNASTWRFSTDPLRPDANGEFLEVPIASRFVHPSFYWRYTAIKLAQPARHRPLGDGRALPLGSEDLARRLFARSVSVVSMDGYKASFLADAYREYRARGLEDFVVMGHPKAFTRYSLERVAGFLEVARDAQLGSYRDYLDDSVVARRAVG